MNVVLLPSQACPATNAVGRTGFSPTYTFCFHLLVASNVVSSPPSSNSASLLLLNTTVLYASSTSVGVSVNVPVAPAETVTVNVCATDFGSVDATVGDIVAVPVVRPVAVKFVIEW